MLFPWSLFLLGNEVDWVHALASNLCSLPWHVHCVIYMTTQTTVSEVYDNIL